MWTLRLILIALGVLFIIGLYLYTRRQQAERRRRGLQGGQGLGEPGTRVEPKWSRRPDGSDVPVTVPSAVPETPPVRNSRPAGEKTAPKTEGEEKIFTLAVRLSDDGVAAETVTRTLARLGCKPGIGQIYHCLDAGGQLLYSVANLFEPGVLDPLPAETPLRGLVFFFTVRPGTNATLPFGRMLGAAREAAERLGGRVQDDNHRPLTAARELELKLAAEGNG